MAMAMANTKPKGKAEAKLKQQLTLNITTQKRNCNCNCNYHNKSHALLTSLSHRWKEQLWWPNPWWFHRWIHTWCRRSDRTFDKPRDETEHERNRAIPHHVHLGQILLVFAVEKSWSYWSHSERWWMLKASFKVCFSFLLRTVDCSSISKTLIFSAIYSCGDFCFSQLNIGARDRRESFFVQDRQMEMAIQTQTSILSQKNEILLLTSDLLVDSLK